MNQETLVFFDKFRKTIVWDYMEALFWAAIIAFLMTSFIIQAFKIPSGSMLNTLQIGDHLFVNKFIYGPKWPFSDKYIFRGADPQRGDVIVFRYPKDPSLDYIKRVVGVPGDVLYMKDKVFYRNGEAVQEPYIRFAQPDLIIPRRDTWEKELTVPEDKYFVMGDNRDDSQDSRFWGFVDRSKIRGKAWIIYWSAEGFSNIRTERIGTIVH